MDRKADMGGGVVEGISLWVYDWMGYLGESGKNIWEMVGIGGGGESELWVEVEGDIFNGDIKSLGNGEGGSMGGAMIGA